MFASILADFGYAFMTDLILGVLYIFSLLFVLLVFLKMYYGPPEMPDLNAQEKFFRKMKRKTKNLQKKK